MDAAARVARAHRRRGGRVRTRAVRAVRHRSHRGIPGQRDDVRAEAGEGRVAREQGEVFARAVRGRAGSRGRG